MLGRQITKLKLRIVHCVSKFKSCNINTAHCKGFMTCMEQGFCLTDNYFFSSSFFFSIFFALIFLVKFIFVLV